MQALHMTLSTRDKEKPFILVGAAATGLAIQHFIGEAVPVLLYVTQIGVFLVILAVMLPIELRDVGKAAKRLKPTAARPVHQLPAHPADRLDGRLAPPEPVSRYLGRRDPLYADSLHRMVSDLH